MQCIRTALRHRLRRCLYAGLTLISGGCDSSQPPAAFEASLATRAPPTPPAAITSAWRGVNWGAQIARLSEPEGAFFSDTPLSNEDGYAQAAPWFDRAAQAGANVYVGVGPEQNLTFIAMARPSLAFVVDLRRANLLLHVLYKSLFVEARTPREWLAACLGREQLAPTPETSLADWLQALSVAPKSPHVHERLLARTLARMRDDWGMQPSAQDEATLRKHLATFSEHGLHLRYQTTDGNDEYPSLAELIQTQDSVGRRRHFLADEDAFAFLRAFELEDRLLPVVGDFAGPHTFAAIGALLTAGDLSVGSLYASNVEQYLLLDGKWASWQSNLARLPASDDAVLIRSKLAPQPTRSEARRSTTVRAHWTLSGVPLAHSVRRTAAPNSYAELFDELATP